MRSFGRYVNMLGGRFIVAEDVGATPEDMEYVALETKHVVGLPLSKGGSGETSLMTGLGVYLGMKACANEKWGSDSLEGKIVAIQGFGNVATNLSAHLIKEGAQLVVTDIYEEAMERAKGLGATIVGPDEIYDVQCDIFSPNALGGILNDETIPRLKCGIVAGGANNQLREPGNAEALVRRDILYAPDYIINAGGSSTPPARWAQSTARSAPRKRQRASTTPSNESCVRRQKRTLPRPRQRTGWPRSDSERREQRAGRHG